MSRLFRIQVELVTIHLCIHMNIISTPGKPVWNQVRLPRLLSVVPVLRSVLPSLEWAILVHYSGSTGQFLSAFLRGAQTPLDGTTWCTDPMVLDSVLDYSILDAILD